MIDFFDLILLGFELLFLGLIFVILMKIGLWRFLDRIVPFSFFRESYDGSLNLNGLTYQGQVLWIFIVGSSFSILFFFFDKHNYWANFGMFLVFFLPSLILLLRIHTFNDVHILPETGLGYDPFNAFKFSFFSSWPGFLFGFTGLYLKNIPLYVPVLIPLGFIFALIPLFPDYINRFLFWDIRSKKAFEFFHAIGVCAIIFQLMIRLIL